MPDFRPKDGRAPPRQRASARASVAWISSLSAHAFILVALHASGALDLWSRPRSWAVAVRPVSAEAWEANRGLAGALAPEQKPEEPRRIITLPPDVESDPAREERPPRAGTRFLAERDQTVEREMVSRHAAMSRKVLRVPQERATGRRGSGERGEHKIAAPGREGLRGGGGADAEAAAPAPPPAAERLAAPGPAAPPAETPRDLPPLESAIPSDGEGGQRIDGRRVSGMPLREYPRPEGGPDLEAPEGLEEGAETRLHARRFAPAAFWSDVRERILGDWEKRALVLLQAYDPLEDTYFYKPRTVVVGLTLEPSGSLRQARIIESSRLDFYDAIALAAVREVEPFPSPPPGAIGPDGGASIKIRFTWLPSARRRELR